MSALCGYFGMSGDAASASVLEAMSGHLTQCRNSAATASDECRPQWLHAGAALAVHARTQRHDFYQAEGCSVLIVGQALLDGDHEHIAERLASLWGRLGSGVCAEIAGSFSLCILDETRQECLLAIDRAGIHTMHYQVLSQGLLFGSNAKAVSAHPLASHTPDPQSLLEYLYFHTIPSPRTIYRKQARLAPASYLHWQRGSARVGQYWRIQFSPDTGATFSHRRASLLQRLQQAVDDAVRGEAYGAFLSGGTDSSTLTGLLAAQHSAQASAYSIGFDVQGYDELPYARIAARHFGVRHQERYVGAQDVLDAIPRIAAALDQPFGNASVVPAYYCASMAQADGMRCLLGGDGGDELFGGNARYAHQALLSRYEGLPSMLRQLLLEPLLFGLAREWQLAPLRKARRYIEQASAPMPLRLESYNLLLHYGATQLLERDFLATVDLGAPAMQLHACYWSGSSQNQMERMQTLDMRYTLAENDLRKVVLACDMAGIDAVFPMLDDSVVAFSASLPAQDKLRGTQLRHFFKRAMADLLPREILAKQKHGFGLPFGHWLVRQPGLRTCALDTLSDLKRRRIVRGEFIDVLSGQHLPQHPAYHGTMIWLLLMLEQWLARSEHAAAYQF